MKNEAKSVEHIVSESRNVIEYVTDVIRGLRIFEREALSNTILLMERTKMGIPNKKRNAAQDVSGKIGIQGNKRLSQKSSYTKWFATRGNSYWDPKTNVFL